MRSRGVRLREPRSGGDESFPEAFAAAVAVGIFACGLLGLVLQRVLHEERTTAPRAI